MKRFWGISVLGLCLALGVSCARQAAPAPSPPAPRPPHDAAAPSQSGYPRYTYEIVNVFPHDRGAFTEGLLYIKGILLESTGLNGQSSLRKVELRTGNVLKEIRLPNEYFGEGTTVLAGKIYQLTYQTHVGFVYDFASLKLEGQFTYTGEGWGLTTDGHSLIMTDGTNQIRFIDPSTFQVTRTISVVDQGQPLANLNELEWVNGELYANIWQTPTIVRLDPATGKILGEVDFSGLLSPGDYQRTTDVMNGIAYDPDGARLFVTGKDWPKLFEVRLIRR